MMYEAPYLKFKEPKMWVNPINPHQWQGLKLGTLKIDNSAWMEASNYRSTAL